MADLRFAKHTAAILDALPYWFKIRKYSKDSIGARFLNIAGLELDDARYVIDYAYRQCYIETADITQVDFCYKTVVPMPLRVANLDSVFANKTGLIKTTSIKEFFGIDQNIVNKNLHSFEFYYVDEKRNIIYVRQKFNADAIHDNGKITLNFKDGTSYVRPLIPHPVWNFFDEIGALVSCPRLFEEPNIEYKKRIMDVFENKANASRDGLINGIGRELAIRRNLVWVNPKKDLELEDAMIVLNSIKINGEPVDQSQVFLTAAGTALIKAHLSDKQIKECRGIVKVTYVYGLEMHQLHNRDDIKLYNELFTVEGKAKNTLRRYIEILNSESPIFWDSFHWNEHYWDQNEKDVSGVGFIPHLYDGSYMGFRGWRNTNGAVPYIAIDPQAINLNKLGQILDVAFDLQQAIDVVVSTMGTNQDIIDLTARVEDCVDKIAQIKAGTGTIEDYRLVLAYGEEFTKEVNDVVKLLASVS